MGDTSGTSASAPESASLSRSLNYEALKMHVISHKIDCGLWAIRILAIFFAFGYLIPIFG